MEENELKTLTFKVSVEDGETIDRNVRESGLSRSDYIRQRLLTPSAPRKEEAEKLPLSKDPIALLQQLVYGIQRIISGQYQIAQLAGGLSDEQMDVLAAHTIENGIKCLVNLDERMTTTRQKLIAAQSSQSQDEK